MGVYGNTNKKKLNKELYFISKHSLDQVLLTPRIPDNYFTKNGYEDNKTPRVCFAPSIQQCLIAMSSHITGKVFYVHTIDPNIDDKKFRNMVYYPTTKEVPDCEITEEVWILKPISIYLQSKIKVIESGDNRYRFTYGEGKEAYLFDWKYKTLYDYNPI